MLPLTGLLCATLVACTSVASIAAGGLLHPARRRSSAPLPPGCETAEFRNGVLVLRGWRCPPRLPRRGTLIFLHGVADNRSGVRGVAGRFNAKGLDVIAYDSRAHGESDGDVCTYGYYEKEDLGRVIDSIPGGPIVLLGTSLGAAVALQAAAEDGRISAVIAAEVFSDLRTIARERAPGLLTDGVLHRALTMAEQRGRFKVDDVSPAAAAARVSIPVLLIHGARDADTRPAHSERVLAALRGPKRLILVEGAGHNQSLSHGSVWQEIDGWLEQVLTPIRQAAPTRSRSTSEVNAPSATSPASR
jgi:pimeloyl-ACP methyl ester carboxylesterase